MYDLCDSSIEQVPVGVTRVPSVFKMGCAFLRCCQVGTTAMDMARDRKNNQAVIKMLTDAEIAQRAAQGGNVQYESYKTTAKSYYGGHSTESEDESSSDEDEPNVSKKNSK